MNINKPENKTYKQNNNRTHDIHNTKQHKNTNTYKRNKYKHTYIHNKPHEHTTKTTINKVEKGKHMRYNIKNNSKIRKHITQQNREINIEHRETHITTRDKGGNRK